MELYVSGGFHTGRIANREESILKNASDLDIVFIEGHDFRDYPLSKRVINWISAPLLELTMYLYLALLSIYEILTGVGDDALAEKLAEEFDAPIYRVDKHPEEIVESQRWLWAVINYLLLFPVLTLGYIVLMTGSSLLLRLFLMFFATAAMAAFGAFLVANMAERNLEIVSQIIQKSKAENADTALIITGKAHASGIIDVSDIVDNFAVHNLN